MDERMSEVVRRKMQLNCKQGESHNNKQEGGCRISSVNAPLSKIEYRREPRSKQEGAQ